MATFPGRFDIIRDTIGSIAPQLDALLVYVNETTENMPDLSDMPNVTIFDGRDHAGDLLANGKPYVLRYAQDCEILTLDDDFIYPADYVSRNLSVLRRMGGRCAVTTHGSVVPEQPDWYYERNGLFPSIRAIRGLQMCNLAGSGTLCFDQRRMKVDIDDLLQKVMVDLKLSLAAKDSGLPLFVLPREDGWLTSVPKPGLWEKYSGFELTHHTEWARQQEWGFEVHARNASAAMAAAGVTPEDIGLDMETADCIRHGGIPAAWKHSHTAMLTRSRYVALLNQILEQRSTPQAAAG